MSAIAIKEKTSIDLWRWLQERFKSGRLDDAKDLVDRFDAELQKHGLSIPNTDIFTRHTYTRAVLEAVIRSLNCTHVGFLTPTAIACHSRVILERLTRFTTDKILPDHWVAIGLVLAAEDSVGFERRLVPVPNGELEVVEFNLALFHKVAAAAEVILAFAFSTEAKVAEAAT